MKNFLFVFTMMLFTLSVFSAEDTVMRKRDNTGIAGKDKTAKISGYNVKSGTFYNEKRKMFIDFEGEYFNKRREITIKFLDDNKVSWKDPGREIEGVYKIEGRKITIIFANKTKIVLRIISERRLVEKRDKVIFMRKETI